MQNMQNPYVVGRRFARPRLSTVCEPFMSSTTLIIIRPLWVWVMMAVSFPPYSIYESSSMYCITFFLLAISLMYWLRFPNVETSKVMRWIYGFFSLLLAIFYVLYKYFVVVSNIIRQHLLYFRT